MSLLSHMQPYVISVDISIQPLSDNDIEDFLMAWFPDNLWMTTITTTCADKALQHFLQELMNNNYADLRSKLSYHGVDVKHFDREITKQAMLANKTSSCVFAVYPKYKTKKERKVREALGMLQMFWVTIRARSSDQWDENTFNFL